LSNTGAALAASSPSSAAVGIDMAEQHEPNAFHHVLDTRSPDGVTPPTWELFDRFFGEPIEIPLPPLGTFFGHKVFLTKYMILELIAAILIVAIFVPIARRAGRGELPKGAWWNAFESLLTFIRNEVAKPALGEHGADIFLPYLWTTFLFVLFCNLLGMIPFLGSPTASIYMTAGLALCSFIMMHVPAMVKMGGPGRYFAALWPHIEIVPNPWGPPGGHGHDHGHGDHGQTSGHAHSAETPKASPSTGQIVAWVFGSAFGFGLSLMIFVIELFGTGIKAVILAVRLFANMFAGHLVLATILTFIYMAGTASFALWGTITVASVLGNVALSLLELFVAFLQAYVFTFLTALFMGMALNPEH
jgi:F-type H+-transporting ATPase subunit a